MKKNVKAVAVVVAVSVLSVNVFGSHIPFYAEQLSQQAPGLAEGREDGPQEGTGRASEAIQEGAAEGSQESNGESGGIQGKDGDAPLQESDGSAAAQGDEGPAAPQESDGSAAAQGDDGPAAPQGSDGSAAAQGDDGPAAPQGSDGSADAQGDDGAANSQGGDENAESLGNGGNAGVQDDEGSPAIAEDSDENALEASFSELIEEYDMYAMLANGQSFSIRSMPAESAGVLHTLPSGYQVKLTGAVEEQGKIWFQVEYGVQDVTYRGYIQELYVVTQDARLQEWRASWQGQSVYGIRDSSRGAAGNTDLSAFPKSYQSYIKALVAAHPNWTFVPMNTGLDWKEVLRNENGDSVNLVDGSDPNTLVTWKSTDASSYDMSTGKWKVKEGNTWVQASESVIKYYMDPRNFLNEESVFQFEQLTYNSSYHTEAGVERVLSGTFMSHKKLEDGSGGGITYAQAFLKIGKELKVSPFFLASRVRQEQGVKGDSALISGTYSGYKGYYNYFNRQATGLGEAVIINGLKEAKSKGWDTRYKALKGGAESVSADYIAKGQDTFYLQKFDVDASYNGLYWHQYMQALLAADSEAKSVRRSYSEMGALDNSFVFKVPVYDNMPSSPCGKPGATLKKPSLTAKKSGDTSAKLSWKEVPGAVGYHVFRAEKDGKYTRIKTLTGLENTSYQDTKAVPGKAYDYKVRAFLKLYGNNLRSSCSTPKTVDFRVPAPTFKSVKIKDYTTASLSWGKEDVTGYRIYRKIDNGSYKSLKTIKANATTSFKDATIEPGHTYTYRIRCYRKINGKNYFSSYSKVKTIKVSISAAVLSKAAVSGGSKVKLTWVQDAKAQGYQIYRATSPNGAFTRVNSIANPATVSWSDTDVAEGNSYYYKIRSYVKSAQGTKTSAFSQVLNVSTALEKPVLTTAKAVTKGIKLTWEKAKNAAGYKVYRSTSRKGAYKEVKNITANGTLAWTDKNVSKGKTYYYRIKSFSLYNSKRKNSVYSNVQSAKY